MKFWEFAFTITSLNLKFAKLGLVYDHLQERLSLNALLNMRFYILSIFTFRDSLHYYVSHYKTGCSSCALVLGDGLLAG